MKIYWCRIKNLFWKDVLKHDQKLCIKCTPLTVDELVSENIHYNINITRERKVVYNREWSGMQITFFSSNSLWIQMETCSILKSLDISFHKLNVWGGGGLYEGIIAAIREHKVKTTYNWWLTME